MRDIVIGCDSGTQAVKAVALRLDGREVALTRQAHPPPLFGSDGGAEQRAELLAKALGEALGRITARTGKKRIAALAITTQRDSLLPLRNGHPVHPLFLWMDRRRRSPGRDYVPPEFRKEPYATWYRQSRILWLREQAPEIAESVTHWGTLGAYFHLLLCGRFVESAAALPLLLPVERWEPGWSSDSKAWKAVGLDREMLPEAVPAGSVVGSLTAKGAQRTGLPAGIPVVATGGDKNCEILGGAARGPTEGVLSLGTALSLGTLVENVEPYRRCRSLWCTPAPVANRWTVEAGVPAGVWTLEWLYGLLNMNQRQLERGARDVPPGSEGLTLIPHLSGTVPHPGARGILGGLAPLHGPGHIYRAALEGLAFEARRARWEIESTGSQPMRTIRLAGGGAGIALFRDILAAVLRVNVLLPKRPAAGARGAAVVASLAVRPGRVEERARRFSGDYEKVTSSALMHRTYERLYESQYLSVRSAVAGLDSCLDSTIG